jgi:hypothetical protein
MESRREPLEISRHYRLKGNAGRRLDAAVAQVRVERDAVDKQLLFSYRCGPISVLIARQLQLSVKTEL